MKRREFLAAVGAVDCVNNEHPGNHDLVMSDDRERVACRHCGSWFEIIWWNPNGFTVAPKMHSEDEVRA